MPELDAITIKGFKSIAAVEKLQAFGAINVLIGPNGSGKSNFIGVFAFLNAIRDGQLQEYVARAGGADRILHFGSKTTPTLMIHISFKDRQRPIRDCALSNRDRSIVSKQRGCALLGRSRVRRLA